MKMGFLLIILSLFLFKFGNGFEYQMNITVTNPNGFTLNGEDILIVINTKGLVDYGKLESDCSDLEFFYGGIQIDAFLESRCNKPNTQVWLRVDLLPGESIINMNYGSGTTSGQFTADHSGNFVILFDLASCPSGFVKNTDFDSRFPMVSQAYGNIGGSSGHNHVYLCDSSVSGDLYESSATIGGDITSPSHFHSMHATPVSNANNFPPYYSLPVCSQDNAAKKLDFIPNTVVMFVQNTLPNGWINFGKLNDMYFHHDDSNYQTYGGSEYHTHPIPKRDYDYCEPSNYQGHDTSSTHAASNLHLHENPATSTFSSSIPNDPNHHYVTFAVNSEDAIATEGMIFMYTDTDVPIGYKRITYMDDKYIKGTNDNMKINTTGGNEASHDHDFAVLSGVGRFYQNRAPGTGTGKFMVKEEHCHWCNGSTDTSAFVGPSYISVILLERKNSIPTVLTGIEQKFCTGVPCEINSYCFGILDTDTANLPCSGHGNCEGPNTCVCTQPYIHPDGGNADCGDWNCFGVRNLEENVCSGHGNCSAPETCTDCEWPFTHPTIGEEDCGFEIFTCFDFFSNNKEKVCSGHGNCIGEDVCECDEFWRHDPDGDAMCSKLIEVFDWFKNNYEWFMYSGIAVGAIIVTVIIGLIILCVYVKSRKKKGLIKLKQAEEEKELEEERKREELEKERALLEKEKAELERQKEELKKAQREGRPAPVRVMMPGKGTSLKFGHKLPSMAGGRRKSQPRQQQKGGSAPPQEIGITISDLEKQLLEKKRRLDELNKKL